MTSSMKQEMYQICVSIFQCRHLAWPNMDPIVCVQVGEMKKYTAVRHSTDCPYFNEYFTFEVRAQFEELMDKMVSISVYQARLLFKSKKLLGSMRLDLATVWLQSDHQFFHKWALMTDPSDALGTPRGYVKCDISIIGKGGTVPIPTSHHSVEDDDDDIEGNLLVPENMSQGRQRARYTFEVYRADGLSTDNSALAVNVKRSISDLPDPVVHISFAGLSGKTSVKRRSVAPVWNEEMIFTDAFPPLGQRVKVQLRDQNRSGIIATHFIDISAISNNGDSGFVPTFGPSFVHLYGTPHNRENEGAGVGACYRGRLLLSLDTDIADNSPRGGLPPPGIGVAVQPREHLHESEFWQNEEFLLVAVLFEAAMLERKMADKPFHVEISLGNAGNVAFGPTHKMLVWNGILDKLEECAPLPCHSFTDSMEPAAPVDGHSYCTILMGNDKPCLHVRSLWPDLRRRMYISNMLTRLVTNLRSSLKAVQPLHDRRDINAPRRLADALDELTVACRAYISMSAILYEGFTSSTMLDRERKRFCNNEVNSIEVAARSLGETVDASSASETFRQSRRLLRRLEYLVEDPQHSLPDVFVWLVSAGKRVAFQRIPSRDLVFSMVPEQRGRDCGKISTIILQTLGKKTGRASGWVAPGKLDMFMWLGLARYGDDCLKELPPGFEPPLRDSIPPHIRYEEDMSFQARAHVYQGRINPGADKTGLCDPLLKVFIGNQFRTTEILHATLNPTWNQMLLFENITIWGSPGTYWTDHPPTIIIELLDEDVCSKLEMVGRGVTHPVMKMATQKYTKPNFPPKLTWVPVYRGDNICSGEILAAFEMLQLSGDPEELKIPDNIDSDHVLCIPRNITPVLVGYRLEVLFWGVRDLKRVHLMSINRPRVSLEIAGHELNSSVLESARRCLNFTAPLQHIDLNLPEDAAYRPAVTLKVADCRSFGCFTVVGCHVLRNLHRYESRMVTEHDRRMQRTSVSLTRATKGSWMNDMLGEPYTHTSIAKKYFGRGKERNWGYFENIFSKKKQDIVLTSRRQRLLTLHDATMEDEKYDWWSKYYEAVEESKKKKHEQPLPAQPVKGRGIFGFRRGAGDGDTNIVKEENKHEVMLKIYHRELEAQPDFHGFSDWLHTFKVYRGKYPSEETANDANVVGKFKGAIQLYRWPLDPNSHFVTPTGLAPEMGMLAGHPSNEPLQVLVRAYIVKGIALNPKDYSGKSDPYIIVELGKNKINDKENYITRNLNPVFGKCFEIKAVFPYDYMLTVRVMDWDRTTADDLIGETKIDLENRFYSSHRASCGIAYRYDHVGYNKWRDPMQPTEILEELCTRFNVEGPFYTDNDVEVGYCSFEMPGDKVTHEELALEALHNWHLIPLVGCRLVPEHVETRQLFNPRKPGIEQGKLQLWVDIFPMGTEHMILPPAVDISPRKPLSYELRCIVWNTEDVVLSEDDFFVGERVSDIYIKGWLKGNEDSQVTDIHYRSMTGEGNFNWRFIFPFDFLAAEDKLVVRRKESFFAIEETEFKIPCRLHLQVWDNDHFSPDDFLGMVSLDLRRIPRGAKNSSKCNLKLLQADVPTINLFKARRIRGWWPFQDFVDGERMIVGKVELELQILTKIEAELCPAGKGRSEPDALEKPNRPDTSLSFFSNPLKALYYVMYRHHRSKLLKYGLLLFLALFILLGVYAVPGYIVKKLLGA